jgi:hypothetical protein
VEEAGSALIADSVTVNSGGTIRLRGNNSITQGNSPVIYVDGIRIYSGRGPLNGSARQGTARRGRRGCLP